MERNTGADQMTAEQPRAAHADIASLQALADDAFVALAEAKRLSGLSKSTIWRKIKAGTFPAPVIRDGVIVRWSRRELREWQAQQFKARDDRAGSSLETRV